MKETPEDPSEKEKRAAFEKFVREKTQQGLSLEDLQESFREMSEQLRQVGIVARDAIAKMNTLPPDLKVAAQDWRDSVLRGKGEVGRAVVPGGRGKAGVRRPLSSDQKAEKAAARKRVRASRRQNRRGK